MKKNFLIIWLFITASFFTISAVYDSVPEDITNDIAAAIRSGNTKQLAQYFNTSIDLTIPENDGTYSKAQAELIVKEFFDNNPPKSFVINHSGSSNDGSLFSVGTYISGTKSFRTYFLVKKIAGTFKIQQLQFELK